MDTDIYYTCGLDHKYRVLVSVVCLSVCLSVSTITQKNKWSRILKFEYIVGCEKCSDEFDIEHCPIKVKVTVCNLTVCNFFPFTTIQTVKCYISALEQDRKLLLSMFVHLILMYNIYEYRHA